MNAEQFFHVCRSAAAIADVRELTVFGAAAIVPWIDRQHPGEPFWPSMELDVDLGAQDLRDLVEGSIGEGSLFEETFGVHAHAVALDAFVAPPDWPSRAEVFVEPRSGVGIRTPCPLDLAIAKLVRGEEKDWEFAAFAKRRFDLTSEEIADGLRKVAGAAPNYAPAATRALSLLASKLGAS